MDVWSRRSVLVAVLLAAAACSSRDEASGQPIAGTDILTCNELPEPLTASATIGNATVKAEPSVIEGRVTYQLGCPRVEATWSAELRLDKISVHEDNAGQPGDELWSSEVALKQVLTCAPSATASEQADLGSISTLDVRPLCAARAPGSALRLHVVMTGDATDCGKNARDIRTSTQVTVSCSGA